MRLALVVYFWPDATHVTPRRIVRPPPSPAPANARSVRVHVHLDSMDVKKQWNELEPRVQSAIERAAKDVSAASDTVVRDVTEALRKLGASLS
jgi:hypothetical protein